MCCRDYTACVFAGFWSIAQTCLHIGWCIWGLYMYQCEYELKSGTFKYFWYLTYFYRNSCITPSSDNFGLPKTSIEYVLITPYLSNSSHDLKYGSPTDKVKPPLNVVQLLNKSQIEFPPESAAANRTYDIFYTFLFVDILWILASIALLVGTAFQIKLLWSTLLYFPWPVIDLFTLFFDAVVAVWYGTDISQTYGITNWFLFIGTTKQSLFDEVEAKHPAVVSTYPSLLMMLLFGRFFVIWIINLFLFFRIVQAAINAYQDFDDSYDEDSIESKPSNQGHLGNSDVINNQRPRNFQVFDVNPKSASARIRRWQLYYGTDDEEEEGEEKRAVRRHPRRHSRQKQIGEEWKRDSAFQYSQPIKTGHHLAVIGGYEGDRSNSPSPLPYHHQTSSTRCEINDLYVSFNEQQESVASSSPVFADIDQNKQIKTKPVLTS